MQFFYVIFAVLLKYRDVKSRHFITSIKFYCEFTTIAPCGCISHCPRMKLMWPPVMELWHILPVYIMCPCDLDLFPIFTKIGSRHRDHVLNIGTYFECYRPLRFWNMRP